MALQNERIYEIAYLVSPDLDDTGVVAFRDALNALVATNEGSIREEQQPTKRRLAYPVAKRPVAYVGSLLVDLSPEGKAAVEKELRARADVIRLQCIVMTEAYLKRLKERRIMPTTAPVHGEKHNIVPTAQSLPETPVTKEQPEKREADITEIEKKLDEILGREL